MLERLAAAVATGAAADATGASAATRTHSSGPSLLRCTVRVSWKLREPRSSSVHSVDSTSRSRAREPCSSSSPSLHSRTSTSQLSARESGSSSCRGSRNRCNRSQCSHTHTQQRSKSAKVYSTSQLEASRAAQQQSSEGRSSCSWSQYNHTQQQPKSIQPHRKAAATSATNYAEVRARPRQGPQVRPHKLGADKNPVRSEMRETAPAIR